MRVHKYLFDLSLINNYAVPDIRYHTRGLIPGNSLKIMNHPRFINVSIQHMYGSEHNLINYSINSSRRLRRREEFIL